MEYIPTHGMFTPFNDERTANADLVAEAFNVCHECGMTPRELMEALKAINDIIFAKGAPLGSNEYFAIREHSCKVLQNTKP